MVERTAAEKADYLSQRRARMLPMVAVIYLFQQLSYFNARHENAMRVVDHVRVSAWIALSAVLLAVVLTGGAWFRPRELRALLNDEVTRAHRLEGIQWGFVAAMATSIGLYFVSLFEPLAGREAIHIILSLGLGAALIRFGILERRAHRDA